MNLPTRLLLIQLTKMSCLNLICYAGSRHTMPDGCVTQCDEKDDMHLEAGGKTFEQWGIWGWLALSRIVFKNHIGKSEQFSAKRLIPRQ